MFFIYQKALKYPAIELLFEKSGISWLTYLTSLYVIAP